MGRAGAGDARAAMNTYVALFRGINVTGNHLLPMKSLKLLLEEIGCRDVRTYIRSGNAVLRTDAFDHRRLAARITSAISGRYGFAPRVLLLTVRELRHAAAGNPFPEAEAEPKSLHLFFLAGAPVPRDLAPLDLLKAKRERFALKGRVFYLHTPDGFGISKLAARVERLLGVEATARNWRTVTTLLEMTKADARRS